MAEFTTAGVKDSSFAPRVCGDFGDGVR